MNVKAMVVKPANTLVAISTMKSIQVSEQERVKSTIKAKTYTSVMQMEQ